MQHGTELLFDLGVYRYYSLHNGFELSRLFNLAGDIACEKDFKTVLGWRGASTIRCSLLRRRWQWLRGTRIVVEPHYHYWDGVKRIPEDCFVSGYWQSEKYFKQVEGILRKDFEFLLPLSSPNLSVLDKIKSCDAISLHIRRGDYVNNEKAAKVYAGCSTGYYYKAVEKIAAMCTNPVLFVFSDDVGWVKESMHFDIPANYICNNVGSESFNDMRLMSECKHNIIANSSFSWWGAWLNSFHGKIVIAPQQWFLTDKFDSRDVIPDSWCRL